MEVILFGISREIVGEKKLLVPAGKKISTVKELKNWMNLTYPGLEKLTSMAVAVDSEYAEDDQELFDGNEVAIIPPVSGG